jgi:hypothetical protein
VQVGDLVKVYNFTHKAREKFRANRTDVDAHYVGLIVRGDVDPQKYGHYREVLRACDGETEFYNVARLEVINESR